MDPPDHNSFAAATIFASFVAVQRIVARDPPQSPKKVTGLAEPLRPRRVIEGAR
jgi:hypothetical protein